MFDFDDLHVRVLAIRSELQDELIRRRITERSGQMPEGAPRTVPALQVLFDSLSTDLSVLYLLFDAPPPPVSGEPSAALVEYLCEVMHDAYETAAVENDWATQERSRKPWAEVPAENKATMRAAVRALLVVLTREVEQ